MKFTNLKQTIWQGWAMPLFALLSTPIALPVIILLLAPTLVIYSILHPEIHDI